MPSTTPERPLSLIEKLDAARGRLDAELSRRRAEAWEAGNMLPTLEFIVETLSADEAEAVPIACTWAVLFCAGSPEDCASGAADALSDYGLDVDPSEPVAMLANNEHLQMIRQFLMAPSRGDDDDIWTNEFPDSLRLCSIAAGFHSS